MYPPSFDAAERRAYRLALNEPTKTLVQIDALDRNHKLIGSLDQELIDGQVNFNRGQDVERTLQAGFADPGGDLDDLDLRHLIQVKHSLWVPALEKWGTVPLFTGTVVAPSQAGDVTTLECHGKEMWGLYPGAPFRTWNEGALVARVIRDMFEDMGETRFRITKGIKARLANKVVSGGQDLDRCPTKVARRLARQAGLQFFYDSAGFLVLRRPPKTPVVSLTEDSNPGADRVTERIRWTRDLRTIRNTVIVLGKKNLRERVEAPANHVYSPRSLRAGGNDAHLVAYLEAEKLARKRDLRAAGRDHLDRLLTERSDAQVTSAPFYHAETHDRIRADKRNGHWGEFYLTEASIPLATGDMTIGYQERRRKRSAGRVRIG